MVLALFLALNMAFVAIALSLNSRVMLNIGSYLFGSISLVKLEDIFLLGGVFLLVMGAFFFQRKNLMMTTYDEESARVSGIPTQKINMGFMLIVGMTIAVSFPIVGILLLSSLLILPVIAASQVARSFKQTLIIAEILSFFSVISGIILSYYFDISASGIIALELVGMFVLMHFIGKIKK